MTDLTIMRAYTEATVKLLLGDKTVRTGLVFLAGDVLSAKGRIELACGAVETNTDVVHIAFTTDEVGETVLSDLTIFAPRDHACYVHGGGRLAQARGAKHAIILPPDNIRGHFEVVAHEIIHRRSSRAGLGTGAIERAAKSLRRLMSTRPDIAHQARCFEIGA